LICTWIENRSFQNKKGKFCDPYLGSLHSYYKNMGLTVITITLPVFPIKLLKKVYESGEIIPSIYFTKLSDILRSIFEALFLKKGKRLPNSKKLDLATIFEYEMIGEKGNVCYAFLHYQTCLRLFGINSLS